MATVTKTFTYTSDADSFVALVNAFWVSNQGNDFSNNSAPGCMDLGASSIVSSFGASARTNGLTWEDLGVPAGATVNSVAIRLRGKIVTRSGAGMTDLLLIAGLTHTGSAINVTSLSTHSVFTDTTGVWATYTGITSTVGAGFAPSNTVMDPILSIQCTNGGGGLSAFEMLLDTVELTITYTPVNTFFGELAAVVDDPYLIAEVSPNLAAIVDDPTLDG